MHFRDRPLPLGFLLASAMLYVACLPLESFCVNGSCSDWPGWGLLVFGWLGVVTGHPSDLTWLANPLLFAAWPLILAQRRRAAISCAVPALTVSVSFFMFGDVVSNEAGIVMPVTGLRAGYWLWIASIGSACFAAVFLAPSGAPLTRRR